MSDLLIKIEGNEYPTWTDFYLKKSLEEVAHSFNFSVNAKSQLYKIQKHDDVKILFGGELYTAGRIDTPRHRLTGNENYYQYSGRSYVRDLIDSYASTHYTNKKLNWIFSQLCNIYSVPFSLASGVSPNTVKEFVLTAESPWQKMVSETMNQGLIITSDRKGGVILDKAHSEKIGIVLEEGVNFTQIEDSSDGSSQYSIYVLRSGELEVRVKDPDLFGKLHRPLDINLDREAKSSELRNRATAEMKRGRSIKYKIRFGGWEYAPGQFWDVNYLVNAVSPSFELSRYMLISQVEFYLKQRSQYVDLTLEDKEIYE